MRQVVRSTLFLAAAIALAACYDSESTTYPTQKLKVSADRAGALVGFGLQSGGITGFGPGIVSLTGGGSYDPSTATLEETVGHGNGGFSCLNTVDRLNLNGCQTGQGVRWDTEQMLASTGFKCTAAEAGRTAFTDEHTVVFKADFYLAGDGNDETFKANMIVADHDLDDQQEGVQNVWIQGVGCSTGTVNFSQAGRPFIN
jgi:hypothetical protein